MANVQVVQCCNRTVKPLTAMSVAQALTQSGHNCHWSFAGDSDIGRSRSLEASSFLWSPNQDEVLVFIDDDIGFDVPSFRLLIDCCLRTREIACGMYVVRDTANPHAALALLPGTQVASLDTEPMLIKWGASGFMAIHRQVLERLVADYPWGHDIPVVSGPRYMAPFFLEMIHAGQYLSEDFSFCQRAAELGIKTWLDPRIKLSHLGEREYTIRDMAADALKQVVTVTIDEGGPDPTGVLEDLAQFLSMTRSETWSKLCATPFRKYIAAEWQTSTPITAYQVNQFYAQSKHYLLELAKFNTIGLYERRSRPARSHQRQRVIDFGGGIGTLSLMLHKLGRQVTYVELPSWHRQFAEFRFQRRHADIQVASNLTALEDASHDCLVAMDVMEHIHPDLLPVVVQEMWRVLEPGGIVIDISDFGETEDQPYHFGTEALFQELMLVRGFESKADAWVKPAHVLAEASIPAMTAA